MKYNFKLPGSRIITIELTGYETLDDVREMIADKIGVKSRNWGIYTEIPNRLKLVRDGSILLSDVPEQLYFYPRAVIR